MRDVFSELQLLFVVTFPFLGWMRYRVILSHAMNRLDCEIHIYIHIYLNSNLRWCYFHGPLTRYVTCRIARAPGMPGTFSPPPRVSDPDMSHGTCVTHVPWCMPGSITSGFFWSRWRGKRSPHSRRFCVTGKRPMERGLVHRSMRQGAWVSQTVSSLR